MGNFGGKGDNLMVLKSHGLPVPDFLIVKNEDLLSLLEKHDLALIQEKISKQTFGREDQEVVKEMIMGVDLGPLMRTEKVSEIVEGGLLAVRSSNSLEDGKNASWAGIFESFLMIKGEDVGSAIKKCWASAFTVNAFLYCTMVQKQPLSNMEVNIIIQNMVDSKVSGVAFSKNPASEADDGVLIEYVEGTGDELVSGRINPKRLNIDRLKANLNTSTPFPISELLDGMVAMEKKLQCLVDIEWAWDGSTLYFLQVRPITA